MLSISHSLCFKWAFFESMYNSESNKSVKLFRRAAFWQENGFQDGYLK